MILIVFKIFSDPRIFRLRVHDNLHVRVLPEADHVRLPVPRGRLLPLPLQHPRHRGRVRVPHLHLRRQRYRLPQDPPCAACAEATEGHQQGQGAEEGGPVSDRLRQDHRQHCGGHPAAAVPLRGHRGAVVQGGASSTW